MTSPWSRIVCWSTEMSFCPIWTHDGSFPVSDTVFAHFQQLKWPTTPKNEWIGSIFDLEPRANNSFWDVAQDHRGESGPKKVLGSRRKTSNLGISASEVLYTNTEVSGDFQLQKMSELEYFLWFWVLPGNSRRHSVFFMTPSLSELRNCDGWNLSYGSSSSFPQ